MNKFYFNFILSLIFLTNEPMKTKKNKLQQIDPYTDFLFVLEAVKKKGTKLWYASDELKNNEEIVMAAVKNDGIALFSASDNMKNNKKIVLQAVQKKGRVFFGASDELRNDKKFLLEALNVNPEIFILSSQEIQEDIELYWKSKRYFKFFNQVHTENLYFKFR